MPCCEKGGLKKGLWTPEEDKKLVAYVEKHGHGNWRSVPDKAGNNTNFCTFFLNLSLNVLDPWGNQNLIPNFIYL